MLQSMVIKFVISFVIRQLEKFTGNLDWNKVEADLDARVRALVPGTWFDDEAVSIVNAALNAIKVVLNQGNNIQRLLELLTAQKYDEAVKLLKDIVLGHLSLAQVAYTPAQTQVKDLLLV